MHETAHLILGGAGAIARATAARVVAAGGRVMLAGRTEATLTEAAAALGPAAAWTVADATDAAAVDRAGDEARSRFGRLDGIANCVGSILLKPAHLTRPEEFELVLRLNLVTAFNAVRTGGRLLASHGGGAVVLVSSAAARIGLANHEAIAAAKAGVEGLARAASATYAAKGMRVTVVAPGLVRTPLAARITGSPAAEQASLALHPLGRLGLPEDIGSAIAFLLDPAQSWTTGQVLGVDGGLGALKVPR
ncbi:MAG: SDR family NAD(P)-dependent oxidoreductase [Gemmatimonadota bacterium]